MFAFSSDLNGVSEAPEVGSHISKAQQTALEEKVKIRNSRKSNEPEA